MFRQITGGVAVIEKEGKHFLIKQSKNKPLGSQWRHPGGSFKPGETETEGIVRELKEETGLDVKVIQDKPFHIEKIDYKPGYFGFYRTIIIDGILKLDKREIEAYGWFTLEKIKTLNLMKATRLFYEKLYLFK